MKTFITKIKPEIDKAKLKQENKKVEKSFLKTAKSFSKAMSNSFETIGKMSKFGFIAGAVAKLVNPLEEINQTLNNTLENFDQIGRLGDQLGINDVAGIGALITALQSKGIDRSQTEKILNELQTEIGKSRSGDETAKFSGLSADENALTLFAKVMNKISTMQDVSQAKSLASSVFGEKEASRLFDALRSQEEFSATYQEAYRKLSENDIRKLQELQGQKDKLQALQDLDIMIERAKKINDKTIQLQLQSMRKSENLKTSQIGQFESATKTNEILDDTKDLVQKGVNWIGDLTSSAIDYFRGEKKNKSNKSLNGDK